MSVSSRFSRQGSGVSVDEFVTWPTRHVDPWQRMSALQHDCIMVVEFSELEGPKPALMIPESPGVHFDANDFSLWLMTADYQLTSRGPFAIDNDIQMVLKNEEQGVHTYAHHFILFDIEARGFVRPFCIAYLTKESDLLPTIFESLREEVNTLLDLLKLCNKRLFVKQLTQSIDTLNTVENQAISSYYGIYYDSDSRDPTKTEVINVRTRRLYRELQTAHKALSDARAKKQAGSERKCSAHQTDVDGWMSNMIEGKSKSAEKDLMAPLCQLSPCVYEDFCKELRHLWCKFRRETPMLRFLSAAVANNNRPGAIVNLDSFPLLSLPAAQSRQLNLSDSQSFEDENFDDLSHFADKHCQSEEKKEADGLLCSILPTLPHLILPLLTGQFTMVCGGDMRRTTVANLVHKLRRLVPCNTRNASSVVRRLHEGRVPATAYADFRLFGVRFAPSMCCADVVASNVRPFISILDLNSDLYHSPQYKGRILQRVSNKNSSMFCNDDALLPYVYSVIGDYAMLAYLLYYFVYSNHETYRKNARYLAKFASSLHLEASDMKIVRYLVELIKTQQLEPMRMEGAFESLFLDNEPSKLMKL